MTIGTNDEATQNVDVETRAPTGQDAPGAADREVPAAERKAVERWLNAIKVSRAFDEEVRRTYGRDRSYCRAESSATVQYSLIQAYIDILVAFLVARNPDFDCTPAPSVGQEGAADAKLHGETMSIVIAHLLKSAKIKRKAKRLVRSALSVGIGWLKVTWQERWTSDPHIKDQLGDAQQNLAQIDSLIRLIQSGEVTDMDAVTSRLAALQRGMAQNAERIVASGMAIDVVNPEDMVFSLDCDQVLDCDYGSWMGNRYFIHKDIALADFEGLTERMIEGATRYSPRKPRNRTDDSAPAAVREISIEDADSYVTGGTSGQTAEFICAWEIWDGEANEFFTVIEGLYGRFAEQPAPPPTPTTRFYPYFGLSFTEVDGERHPQSLVQRSYKLQDEIERSMQNLITHRRRSVPKLGFDASKLAKETVEALEKGTTAEFVAIKLIGGVDTNTFDLTKSLFPITYNTVDMGLYATEPFVRAMETIWGIQEALTSTVQVAKTATEADIQQAGTQAKTGFKRDMLEELLSDLGQYTAEIASFKLDLAQAQAIAGAGAYWIQSVQPEDLASLLLIEVRAGSSGKPDTAAKREAWAATLPQIKEMMMMIANLRQTTPPALADNMEQLLLETADRAGDKIDAVRFIPQAPDPAMMRLAPNGRPLSNEEAAKEDERAAQQQAGQDGAPAPGGPPPAENGQEQLAPTALPPGIAG